MTNSVDLSRLPPNDLLRETYASRTVKDADGHAQPLHSAIDPRFAGALYRTILETRPRLVVEVGMCFGLSSLSILTALEEVGGDGQLVSIDPYQHRNERGIGVLNVERAGLAHRHTLREEPSFLALPALLQDGASVDMAYIDGWHTFDYALLDFFYLDKLLRVGGVIGFNDCGWRSVHRVLHFVRTHRKYEELDVGLAPNYQARNPLFSLVRRVTGRSGTDRYFKKVASWEPDYSFYKRF